MYVCTDVHVVTCQGRRLEVVTKKNNSSMDADTVISLLCDNGLLGAFESLAEWCGERTAVVTDPQQVAHSDVARDHDANEDGDQNHGPTDEDEGDKCSVEDDNPDGDTAQLDVLSDDSESSGSEPSPPGSEAEGDGDLLETGSTTSGSGASMIEDLDGISVMELLFAVRSLARQLRLRFGVKCGDKVLLVCKDETPAEIVGMLASIQLGACFVPIAPDWIDNQSEQLRSIVEDARPVAAVVVAADDSDPSVAALASVGHFRCSYVAPEGTLVEYDASVSVSNEEDSNVPLSWWDDHPLYILYTSGSTGRPKGVLGTHRGLVNRILWAYQRFPWRRAEIACRRTPLTFVDSLAETFAPLLAGVPIWPCPRGLMRDRGLLAVAPLAQAAGVTRITLLPSQLFAACSSGVHLGEIWPKLKIVVISGEECQTLLVDLFQKSFPNQTLINLYGSTEVAGDITCAVLCDPNKEAVCKSRDGPVSIGSAIMGNTLFVVSRSEDGALNLCPDGEAGELFAVGEHVAMGYYNRSEETAAKFVLNPFSAQTRERLGRDYEYGFLTGDLVRLEAQDGESQESNEISFTWLGRIDRMVKVRGMRVELEGMERCIFKALGVCDGCALVNFAPSDESASGNPSVSIVLCVDGGIAGNLGCKTGADIQNLIRDSLESASYPPPNFALVFPSGLPRTTSGKVSRGDISAKISKELRVLRKLASGNQSSIQSDILRIYLDVLPHAGLVLWERMESHDGPSGGDAQEERLQMLHARNFYELGGDSMSGVVAAWKLREKYGAHFASQDVLKYSISELSDFVAARSGDDIKVFASVAANDAPPSKRSRRGDTDFSFRLVESGGKSVAHPFPIDFHNEITSNKQICESDGSLAASPTSIWHATLKKCVDSTPLVVEDVSSGASVVYVGSHAGDFCCFNARDGALLWIYSLGGHMEGSCALLRSPSATTERAGGSIVVCAYAGSDVDGFEGVLSGDGDQVSGTEAKGLVCCCDAVSGSPQWRRAFPGEIKAAPCIDDYFGVVYVACYDQYVYALDGKTGDIRDRVCCNGSVFSSPVLLPSEESCSQKYLVCATTNGSLLIIQSTRHQSDKTTLQISCALSIGAPIFARPLVAKLYADSSPRHIIIGTVDGTVRCLSMTSWPSESSESSIDELIEVWRVNSPKGAVFSSPCLIDSPTLGEKLVLFGSHDGRMRCVQAETGAQRWETDLGSSIFASPVCLALQRVPNRDEIGQVLCLACTTSGDFVVLDASSGSVLRLLRLPGEIYSTPAVAFEGMDAIVGCRDNRLHCIRLLDHP